MLFWVSGDPFSNNHEAAVVLGVFTGGKTQDLVAVLSGDAGVIEGHGLNGADKFVELFLALGLYKSVVGETNTGSAAGLEYGKDLISMMLIKGVEGQGRGRSYDRPQKP